MKLCIDCETDIRDRGNRAERCEDCQEEYRRNYNKQISKDNQRKIDLQIGSRHPSKIGNDGCGNNKKHDYPRKKQVWMHYWTNKFGEPMDEILQERDRAIGELNKQISKTNNTIKTDKSRKNVDIYRGWVY